jgi:hypothetical protein
MMLRIVLAAVSLLAFIVGLIFSIKNHCLNLVAIWSGVIFVSLLFERWRYNAASTTKAHDDIHTGERFIDPETGALMEVMYNSRTGERKYISVPTDKDEAI